MSIAFSNRSSIKIVSDLDDAGQNDIFFAVGGWRRVVAYAAALTLAVLAVNVIRCILLTVVKTDHPVRFVFEHE